MSEPAAPPPVETPGGTARAGRRRWGTALALLVAAVLAALAFSVWRDQQRLAVGHVYGPPGAPLP